MARKDPSVADVKPEAPADCIPDTAPPAGVKAKIPKSTKKTPAKAETAQEEKPKKDKVPRGKNAFMHFVCAKRAEVAGRPLYSSLEAAVMSLAPVNIPRLANKSVSMAICQMRLLLAVWNRQTQQLSSSMSYKIRASC